jgi:hypothetical protein
MEGLVMKKYLLFLVCVLSINLLFISSTFAVMIGLVGAWTFDKDEGGKVKDDSGNGFNGELVGNAKIDKNGKYGSAVSTDGTEAYVMIPDDPAFEFDGDFSIACWVWNENPASDHSSFVTKGYHRTAGNGGDAKPWYLIYYLKTGTIDFFLRDTNAVNSRAVGKTVINDGQWHHVVCMKAGKEVKVYVDGKEDGSAPAVDAKYGENTQPLVFMVHYDRWFAGKIDDVAIFNKALNDNEIKVVMGGINKGVLEVSPIERLTSTWGNIKK